MIGRLSRLHRVLMRHSDGVFWLQVVAIEAFVFAWLAGALD